MSFVISPRIIFLTSSSIGSGGRPFKILIAATAWFLQLWQPSIRNRAIKSDTGDPLALLCVRFSDVLSWNYDDYTHTHTHTSQSWEVVGCAENPFMALATVSHDFYVIRVGNVAPRHWNEKYYWGPVTVVDGMRPNPSSTGAVSARIILLSQERFGFQFYTFMVVKLSIVSVTC